MDENKLELLRLSRTSKPILILGETGTGKSYYANEIHKNSRERNLRFIRLNINSLNENLFESELFGHEKGSFSGAINHKIGFCEAVGGGTLFIDEIGDLPLSLQGKLLTLIDEGCFHRVGSCEERVFKGRLIFATNKNLQEMVSLGTFRKDLFFRLRFFLLELTPLRLKSNKFQIILAEINNAKIRYTEHKIRLSSGALEVLNRYEWPGNYREMKNTIEYLFELDKVEIIVNDMPSWLWAEEMKVDATSNTLNFRKASELFELEYYKRLLAECKGSIKDSVEVSGISKVTIISKLKKYGIDRMQYKLLPELKRTYGF